MDIDRIAVVLHSAVLKKLQNELLIPETLTQEQVQVAYDRVYDILQQAIVGRDIKINKIDIQKEATLRSIQEIPIAIRDATKDLKKTLEPPKDTSQDNPADIQNLVEQELQKRGMQDQSIGAAPPDPLPTPAPTGSDQVVNTQPTPSTNDDTYITNSFTPDGSGSGNEIHPQSVTPFVLQQTPQTPQSHTPPNVSFEPTSTLISFPNNGSDGVRWGFDSKSPVLGITYVHLPHLFVKDYPYLIINVVNDGITMSHPLIHTSGNWYQVPKGNKCLGGLIGSFRVSITDPNGEVLRTKYTLKEAQENHTFYTKAVIDPRTDIAHTFDDIQTQTPSQETTTNTDDDETNKDTSNPTLSPDDEVILLFKDHSISVFFRITPV